MSIFKLCCDQHSPSVRSPNCSGSSCILKPLREIVLLFSFNWSLCGESVVRPASTRTTLLSPQLKYDQAAGCGPEIVPNICFLFSYNHLILFFQRSSLGLIISICFLFHSAPLCVYCPMLHSDCVLTGFAGLICGQTAEMTKLWQWTRPSLCDMATAKKSEFLLLYFLRVYWKSSHHSVHKDEFY